MKLEYNRLLKRQLKKYLDDENATINVSEHFLDAVNEAYLTFETDYQQLDRMLEISSEELFKANQSLSKANEELDRFVYSASHDLKAPLTSLMGLVNLSKIEIKDPESIAQYLELMQSSIYRLMKVINDLADFSRNERLVIEHKLIDFDMLIIEIVESLKFMPNAEKIDFKVDIPKSDINFYSDSLRLRILLNNLIANALLYHNFNQRTPLIIIEIIYDDKKAAITVMDNGRGIEEKHHKRIFDMFYRASNDSKGSGLGLYIVKGIVDKLQGEIFLDSELGQGTLFKVEIPNMSYRSMHKS